MVVSKEDIYKGNARIGIKMIKEEVTTGEETITGEDTAGEETIIREDTAGEDTAGEETTMHRLFQEDEEEGHIEHPEWQEILQYKP